MADRREDAGSGDLPAGDDPAGGISELQARLDELQRSVEILGSQGVWASTRGPARPAEPPIGPAPGAPPAPPAQPPHVQPPVPAEEVPAPAATNGHTDEEPGISGAEASVAMVDAGPFADLIELRHFEDELSSLIAVHDVRVRRFGQSRAVIEVGMAGPYDLARELPRLGLPMDVEPVGEGELIVEFAPLPTAGDEAPDVRTPEPEADEVAGREA